MRSVELFAGCGGLAYGLAEAGFEHALVIENDPQANATLALNKELRVPHFATWPILAGDVRETDFARIPGRVDLVSGGPPCQPFSIGGKHKGPSDRRNMWPEAIRAVRDLRPKAFIFENVRGLLRPAFEEYLAYLRLQLSWPEIEAAGRSWQSRRKALEVHERSGAEPSYRVLVRGINAADYGAPQKRHRAIMVGVRSDIAPDATFPSLTHSREALIWSQRITGDYWERHGISRRARPAVADADLGLLKELRARRHPPSELPWTTVRDAIGDLPAPTVGQEPLPSHRLHPGARVYDRHTGSSWDEPAKALKAGDHGVPGGENIIVGRRGAVRYFTIREMARLQGLPDAFAIKGTWRSPIKQLGNAVPVHVGRVFGRAISKLLSLGRSQRLSA